MATTASPPSTPAASPPIESFIGSFISLISKYEIRYEGVLYHLNVQDSTIGLRNVRSYGTEGRRKDGPEVPPSDKIFEYILFRGSDIKDLQVKSSSTAQKDEQIEMDPAIVKSHCAGAPLSSARSSAADGKIPVESPQGQSTPAVVTTGFVQPRRTLSHVASVIPSQETVIPASSCYAPLYQKVHGGTLISESLAPQHPMHYQLPPSVSSFSEMQNHTLGSGLNESPVWGLMGSSEVPSVVSSSLLPKNSIVFPSVSCSSVPDRASYKSVKTLPPINAPFANSIQSSTSLVPLSTQATSKAESQHIDGVISEPTVLHRHPYISSMGLSCNVSMQGSLPVPHPPLLSPQQLVQSSLQAHSITSMYPDQDMGAPQSSALSYTSEPLISPSVSQAPLLPSPISVLQDRRWTTQFSQEFDFEAMNQQFNKDEVWGYLGNAKQKEKLEVSEYGSSDHNSRDLETPHLPDLDSKPAYNKDDFFDSISRTMPNRGRNAQTFGRSYPRPNLGHSGYGGHSNFHGSRASGRGYGHDDFYGSHSSGRGYGHDDFYGSHSSGRGRGYGYGGRGRGT